jgi:hypothetical protein
MPKKKEVPDVVALRLRLPRGLHQLLTETARQNNRSLNTEMLWRLAHSLANEGHKDAPRHVVEMADLQRAAMENVVTAILAQRKGK